MTPEREIFPSNITTVELKICEHYICITPRRCHVLTAEENPVTLLEGLTTTLNLDEVLCTNIFELACTQNKTTRRHVNRTVQFEDHFPLVKENYTLLVRPVVRFFYVTVPTS